MAGKLSKIKTLTTFALASLLLSASMGAFAGCVNYVGNPTRPNTFWVPGHCENGCWVPGHYYKILSCVHRADLTWVPTACDGEGHWIPAHWELNNYVMVNPGHDSDYPGWAL